MMFERKCSFLALLFVLVLGACSSKGSGGCPLPPEGFSESDLVGTWGGSVETAWDSTIIIRGDGRYKQILNIKRTGFNYESDWKPWRVTYPDKGPPYLHLEGLLMCAYWDQMDCTGNTNIEPAGPSDTMDPFADATNWRDFCRKEWVETPGEGVFMIFGVGQPAQGIHLVPFTKSPDVVTGPAYKLREP